MYIHRYSFSFYNDTYNKNHGTTFFKGNSWSCRCHASQPPGVWDDTRDAPRNTPFSANRPRNAGTLKGNFKGHLLFPSASNLDRVLEVSVFENSGNKKIKLLLLNVYHQSRQPGWFLESIFSRSSGLKFQIQAISLVLTIGRLFQYQTLWLQCQDHYFL